VNLVGHQVCRDCGGDVEPRISPDAASVAVRCASCHAGEVIVPGPEAREACSETLARRERLRSQVRPFRPVVALWLPSGGEEDSEYRDATAMIRERLVRDDPSIMLIEEPYPDSPDDPCTGPLALSDRSLLVAPGPAACEAALNLLGRAVTASRSRIFATGLSTDSVPNHFRLTAATASPVEPGGLFDEIAMALAGIRREASFRAVHPSSDRSPIEIGLGTDELAVAILLLVERLVSPGRTRVLEEFGSTAAVGDRLESLEQVEAVEVVDDRVYVTSKGRGIAFRRLPPGSGEPDTAAVALGRMVEEARAGCQEALGRLLRLGGQEVQRIAHGRIGPGLRSKVDTVDITQSVMGEIIAGLDRFEFLGEKAWRGYLRRLVENKIRAKADYFGAGRRDYRREVGLPDEEERDETSGPPDVLLRKEEFERLEDSLAEMPEDERNVILLRVFEGLSHREVAERLGRPSEGAVHKLYERALKRLAKILGRAR
jgi:RNA polymerase sigma-70 factor (ECF subfamily)